MLRAALFWWLILSPVHYTGPQGIAACDAWNIHIANLILEHMQLGGMTDAEVGAFYAEFYRADKVCRSGRSETGPALFDAMQIGPVMKPLR